MRRSNDHISPLSKPLSVSYQITFGADRFFESVLDGFCEVIFPLIFPCIFPHELQQERSDASSDVWKSFDLKETLSASS